MAVSPKRVLVVGLGNMGMSHALAYARIDGFEVAGLCRAAYRTRAAARRARRRAAIHLVRRRAGRD